MHVSMLDKFGSICCDSSIALPFLQTEVLPAFKRGEPIVLDFQGVKTMNSSFGNALFMNYIKLTGKAGFDRLTIKYAAPAIKSEIKSAITLGGQKLVDTQPV